MSQVTILFWLFLVNKNIDFTHKYASECASENGIGLKLIICQILYFPRPHLFSSRIQ